MAFPGYVSNRIAHNVTEHLLDKMGDYALKEGKTLEDRVRLSAEEAESMGGPKAYQAFYKMAHEALQGYEARGGQVTVADLKDPVKRGNLIKTIKLVDKDNDGRFEVGEVRSSSSKRAAIILAAAEQFQVYSRAALDRESFGGRVDQAKAQQA